MWKKISSIYPYETPWFKVREDTVKKQDDTATTFYVVECPESVFIVPVTDDNNIVLIKLFRYRTQRGGWEVPAGSVDPGEDHIAAAKRELQEETGYETSKMKELAPSFDSMNGASDAIGHVFIATGLTLTNHNEQAEEGITQMQAFSWADVTGMIKNGEIVDGLSIAALMKYYVETENN